jgi:hypothetical protein
LHTTDRGGGLNKGTIHHSFQDATEIKRAQAPAHDRRLTLRGVVGSSTLSASTAGASAAVASPTVSRLASSVVRPLGRHAAAGCLLASAMLFASTSSSAATLLTLGTPFSTSVDAGGAVECSPGPLSVCGFTSGSFSVRLEFAFDPAGLVAPFTLSARASSTASGSAPPGADPTLLGVRLSSLVVLGPPQGSGLITVRPGVAFGTTAGSSVSRSCTSTECFSSVIDARTIAPTSLPFTSFLVVLDGTFNRPGAVALDLLVSGGLVTSVGGGVVQAPQVIPLPASAWLMIAGLGVLGAGVRAGRSKRPG